MANRERERIRNRLDAEVGRLTKDAEIRVCLAYPSPYSVGMSSLGYQRIYRSLMEHPSTMCERAFLPDDAEFGDFDEPPVTYESLSQLSQFPIVALSVAYELEIAGMIQLLESGRIPALAKDRSEGHPFILAGGPLTFSNPLPMAPFVDAIIMGEAEELMPQVCEVIANSPSKAHACKTLAAMPHVFVPSEHGDMMPGNAQVENELLPAWAPIRTPHTELANMFLIETERGCSRSCHYCVMRRSTNGGMRLVSKEKILGLIPADTPKVGLVGAAVSDHPKIVDIVNELADQGKGVGLSSLRPDRLSEKFVFALKNAGYRTLTTAMDGPSERMREMLDRRARPRHLRRAAERARLAGMKTLKLYLMLGLPGEDESDIDECIAFTTELSKVVPIALGIAPFCAKRNTPLDGAPYAGIKVVDKRLDRLRRGLRGRVDVRSTSTRWAWVEYILAQGARPEGEAVYEAVKHGARFKDYRKAFRALPSQRPRRKLAIAPTFAKPKATAP